jgi:hypothetical protein
MSRLPGVPLDTVRDRLSAAERDRLAGQLGETIAALHQLPPPVIRDSAPRSGQMSRSRSAVRKQRALPALAGEECRPGGSR